MRFYSVPDGEYVRDLFSLLQAANPNTSLPSDLSGMEDEIQALGVVPVHTVEPPTPGQWQVVVEAEPEVINGAYYERWELIDVPVPVPQVVTMRQARLALLQSNLLHLVDPAIDALPEPTKSAARIEWEYSQTVVRDRPFVQMLGAALGLTNEQIDDLFQLGASL